jgi:orotate phosphoribosyltransferase
MAARVPPSAAWLMEMALAYLATRRPLPALYVRKAKKDHGTEKLVEGDKSLFPGIRVALLEDVITTGGSSLKAVEALRAAGANVVGIVALVDREEGGAETIREAGLPLVSLARRTDFMG